MRLAARAGDGESERVGGHAGGSGVWPTRGRELSHPPQTPGTFLRALCDRPGRKGPVVLQCDNPRCTSKHGKRIRVRRGMCPPMAIGLKSRHRPTRVGQEAPKVFRQRNSRKVHHGNQQGRTGLGRCRHRRSHPRTPRRRNPHQGPPGRRREVHLGLPRRCCAAHLRRVLQAGHHPARAGAPRAGGRSRGRRLCARHRRRGRGPGHLGSRRDQCHHRHRHRLHGQHPDGDHHRPGAHGRHRPGRLPGMRHRRHHAPHRQAQLPGEGCARHGRW